MSFQLGFQTLADHVISLISDSTLNEKMSREAFDLASRLNATVLEPLEQALKSPHRNNNDAARR